MPPAPTDVHLDQPWLSIRWDAGHRCVYAEWKGLADSAEFRSGTVAILKAVRDRRTTSLVSDNRRLEAISGGDQIWINESWVRLAVGSGLRRIAVVLAPEGMGKISSEGIISRLEDKLFETRTFGSPGEALQWISNP